MAIGTGAGAVVVGGEDGGCGCGCCCCMALKSAAGLALRSGRGSAVVTGDILPAAEGDEVLCCKRGEDAGLLLFVVASEVVVVVVRFMSLGKVMRVL